MARRSSGRPGIGAYWFEPVVSASAAFATTSSGQPKSGKPWPRLTAPCSTASADMRVKMVVGRLAKRGFILSPPPRAGEGESLEPLDQRHRRGGIALLGGGDEEDIGVARLHRRGLGEVG